MAKSEQPAVDPIHVDDFAKAKNYAADYLRTYYSGEPTPDDQALLRFLVREFPRIKAHGQPPLLEVGCGPVVNHLLPAVPYVSTIQMCDFRDDNLEEVRKWRDNQPGAHDWRRFTRFVLELEQTDASTTAIENREQGLRGLIGTIASCDLRRELPLGTSEQHPVVACFYTTEQASSSRDEWLSVFRNLCGLVALGGFLLTCSVADTDHYIVYDREGQPVRYSTPRLFPEDFQQALIDNGFVANESVVEYQPLVGQENEGLFGVILAAAKKSEA